MDNTSGVPSSSASVQNLHNQSATLFFSAAPHFWYDVLQLHHLAPAIKEKSTLSRAKHLFPFPFDTGRLDQGSGRVLFLVLFNLSFYSIGRVYPP